MSSDLVSEEYVRSFLEANRVENKYFMEYEDFLVNHMPHAAVALLYLDDTKEHFKRYTDEYVKRLEPVDGPAFRKQVINKAAKNIIK
jgi:hypothetical protein